MKPVTYLLRDVPFDLHEEWHFFSRIKGTPMRSYILKALITQIEHDKDRFAATQHEIEGGDLP